MLRFHRATIRLTATTLLVIFLSALLGPVVARAQLRRAHSKARAHLHLPGMPQAHHHHGYDEHDQNDEPNGDKHHDQDEHHAPALHAPKSHHAHHGCTSRDEQQLTGLSPLLKLLAAPAAPALLALPPALSFAFRPFQAWDREQAVALVPPGHLKPKIPDLRIFIGALVI
ncbi:hypothetical protein ACFQT0_30170 [Hymenobacter humi]|uniref:DUF2946 domain-containing protein n=1 Tax=Hymenobacter humi TaxID=1411620 RepID=A0ABW2UEE1_9BACT